MVKRRILGICQAVKEWLKRPSSNQNLDYTEANRPPTTVLERLQWL
jgi:hypothetical protein